MKRTLFHYILAITAWAVLLSGCKRDSDYLKGTVSPFISNFDLRKMYMGQDVVLNSESLRGTSMVRGQVISDHSGHNMPSGLLVLQNSRMVGNGVDSLRGIAVNIGTDASKYVPGDSVHITLEGAVLKKAGGILQITGLTGSNVTKVASGTTVPLIRRLASEIRATPDWFDCTQVTITKATYYPTLDPGEVIAGDKALNDGTENVRMYTEINATFANLVPPYSGNYTGVLFNIQSEGSTAVPQLRIRGTDDIVELSSTVDIPEFVITGFLNDPEGTDAATGAGTSQEYIQFRATQDIDFSVTPFSVVTCNNAGASEPTGFGTTFQGWVTGQTRSYKFELTSGTVNKGDFFYVGGTSKLINGASSTSIASAKWIASVHYSASSHESPAFYPGGNTGARTTNLLANSGNAFGIAVFRGLDVREASIPVDVVFMHGTAASIGNAYQASPERGFRIGNTDLYDVIEPLTGVSQPFFCSGTNTVRFGFAPGVATDNGEFTMCGGIFDTSLGKWVQARRTHGSMVYVDLTKTSTIDEIENEQSTEIR